jgi:copper resistance protein B
MDDQYFWFNRLPSPWFQVTLISLWGLGISTSPGQAQLEPRSLPDSPPIQPVSNSAVLLLEPEQYAQYDGDGNGEGSPGSDDRENWPEPINDTVIYSLLQFDELEYRIQDGEDTLNWDLGGWVGGDYQRLQVKSEGDVGLEAGHGEAEVQLLYGRTIAPFWEMHTGIRYDQEYGEDNRGRGFAVLGVEGVTPYLFEVDAALFVSHQGDISARFEAEYELLLSQRLIVQPSLETNLALQQAEEFGVGSGLNDIELGVRLRYEVSRQFAPYLGIHWERQFGDTAELAEEANDQLSLVGGFRLLF